MRTILISGASRGIGRRIAERALLDGHRLSLGLRDINSLKGTILDPSISGEDKVHLHTYEATNQNSAKNWVSSALGNYKSIDTVINCAGIFHNTKLIYGEGEYNKIQDLFNINVMGPWLLTKEAWEPLSQNRNGRIIVLVSMSGTRSKGKLAGYTMSKFALMGLCQTIRNEGWDKGIRVSAICPSWVNTDMAANVNIIPKAEMTQPEDIASISSNLLELPNSCVPFEIKVNCCLEI